MGNSFDGEIERATYPRQFEDRFSLDGVRASIRLKTVWRDIDEDFPRVYGVLFTWKQAGIDITPSSYLLRRILDSDIGLPVFSGRNWQAAMKVEDDVPAYGNSLVRSLGVGPGTRYVSLADRAGKKVWLAHERNPEDIVL